MIDSTWWKHGNNNRVRTRGGTEGDAEKYTERDVENVLMASVYHGTEFQCLHLNCNWCSCLFIQLHLKQKACRDANVD